MSYILNIEDRNKGSIIKQGDKTVLKYKLIDGDGENINWTIDEIAEVVVLNGKDILYRTSGIVNYECVVEFTIDEVLPIGQFHIEFIVKDKIFPSGDKPYFTITRSSKGNDINIIKVNGFEELVVRTVGEVEERLAPFVAELETNELTRTTNEANRIAEENTRKANEVQRNEKQIRLKNLIVNGDFSNGITGWLGGGHTGTVSANIYTAKITTLGTYNNIVLHPPVAKNVGDRIYYSGMIKPKYSLPIGIRITGDNVDIARIDKPTVNAWNTVSNVVTTTNSTITAWFFHHTNTNYEIGDEYQYSNLVIINLTKTFGAGNEPTKEQMDELLAITGYISGERVVSHQEMFKLIGARAKKKQEDWITPALINGATGDVQFRRNDAGVVEFRGNLHSFMNYGLVLPVGYQPKQSITVPVSVAFNSSPVDIKVLTITSIGRLYINVDKPYCLDGVRFPID